MKDVIGVFRRNPFKMLRFLRKLQIVGEVISALVVVPYGGERNVSPVNVKMLPNRVQQAIRSPASRTARR